MEVTAKAEAAFPASPGSKLQLNFIMLLKKARPVTRALRPVWRIRQHFLRATWLAE